MGKARWIVGVLGWVAYGPIGALLGYLFGSVIDKTLDAAKQITGGSGTGSGQGTTYTRTTGGGYTQSQQGSRPYSSTEQRNSFFVSLLVLSSAVIRADGKTLQSEVDVVKDFIRRNFGDNAVSEAVRILDSLSTQQIDVYSVGTQIANNMNYSQRLQLFHYLTQIAIADGDFSKSEKDVLEAIGGAIRLNSSDITSIISMHYKDKESAYAVLEISPSATADEIKAAYRRMAMKYHPDKVATLGPEVQKAAEEKFRKIQEAYETIKKERGIS
ncbi:MAG: TerB family tellurite resistance protein [Bacteroidales bacterium]|jgi:DnaJ like chaperone protein|nr:TerB family tellurite resistance protein [Bacteroidales bacterium]